MRLMETVYQKAKQNKKRVAIPECCNETMLRACRMVQDDNLAEIVFVGNPLDVQKAAANIGLDISDIEIVDSTDDVYKDDILERYMNSGYALLGKKSIAARMAKPIYMSLVMEAVGDVDVTFAGIETSTGEVVYAANSIIGLAEGVPTASCFFAVELKHFKDQENYFIGMSDGAVAVDPTPEQLAGIAISCCDTVRALTGEAARCALLSFSTLGSGTGPQVDKVVEAKRIANELRPDLKIDGEFQADAALLEESAKRKVKRESEVAGKANMLVFPNIESCNIGSKMVQMMADCTICGPILQGFKKPVCDCSRSDKEKHIYDNIACSCVLAK